MVSAEPFCTGRASLHLVKWSDNTKILVLPLGVGVSGPTKSMESTCQGRPACSLCLFLLGTGLLCLVAWHASHEFTSLLMSAVMPGQNQSACTLLVVLSMPVCPCLWASHATGFLSDFGHSTFHFPSGSSCFLIFNTPPLTSV